MISLIGRFVRRSSAQTYSIFKCVAYLANVMPVLSRSAETTALSVLLNAEATRAGESSGSRMCSET